MRLYLILTLLCSISVNILYAQHLQRYRDILFSSVDIKYDRSYAFDTNAVKNGEYNKFDVYQPRKDTARYRPAIIWIHGGGFIFGSKKDENIRLWCQSFARRGYVCIALNYRLGQKTTLLNFGKLVKNAYPAVLDARQAIQYLRQHHEDFGIDPDRIILAGNSAGAMIALNTAFANNLELADTLKIQNPETFGPSSQSPTRVFAVINFWGGIYDINWLKNEPIPVVNVFGSNDQIVQPGYHNGTYGGEAIYQKLISLNRATALKKFPGVGHELYVHFNPLPVHPGKAGIRKRWLEAGQFASDFLYRQLK